MRGTIPWKYGANNTIGLGERVESQDNGTEDGSGTMRVGVIGYKGSEYRDGVVQTLWCSIRWSHAWGDYVVKIVSS